MDTEDTCVSLVPYFKVHAGQLPTFKQLGEQFIEKTRSEPGVVFYAFSFHDDEAHCREGYKDAKGLLAHLENVGDLLKKALAMADLIRLEVHGPEDQIAQLREPLSGLNPKFYVLTNGFRRSA
jgi:quinol monooxygenase YgiN